MATVGRGADQYTVRLPDGLRDRIKAAADDNNRSMNAEIVATLEEKYPAPTKRRMTVREVMDLGNRFDACKTEAQAIAMAELINSGLQASGSEFRFTIFSQSDYPDDEWSFDTSWVIVLDSVNN